MKSNVEIIGLPLMGIQDGIDCGIVSDLIFSAEQKNVQFLVLDNGRGLFSLKALAFSKITGIGKDVITTQSSSDIKPLWEDKEAISLGFTSANILNARIISNEGNVVGRVSEFFLDEKTGAIEQLQADNGTVIPGENVLTLASGSVFTSGTIPDYLPRRTTVKHQEPASVPPPSVAAPAPALKEPHKPRELKNSDPSLSGLFQKRQIEYLIGREITKDIKGKNGKTLAKSGDIVTEELVMQVKDEGRMPELTLNVK